MFKLSWDFHVYQVINHMKQFVYLSIIFALNACKRHVTNFLTLFTMFTNNYICLWHVFFNICCQVHGKRSLSGSSLIFPFLYETILASSLHDQILNLISSYIFISLIMLMKANVNMHNFVKWAPNENFCVVQIIIIQLKNSWSKSSYFEFELVSLHAMTASISDFFIISYLSIHGIQLIKVIFRN